MRTIYFLLIFLFALPAANQPLYGQTNTPDKTLVAARLKEANQWFQKGRNYHFILRDPKEALICYDSAMQIRRQYLPEEHPDIAHLYNNIGLSKAVLGYTREAIELHQKALQIRQKHYPPQSDTIGHSLVNLGLAYGYANEPEKCIDFSLQALAIFEQSNLPGPKKRNIAFAYNNLAGAYLYEEEWEKALNYLQKAQELLVDPQVEIISNMGAAYFGLKRYSQALSTFQKVDSMLSKNSPESPILTGIWNNIGSAFQKMGQYREAEQWHRNALALSRKLYGRRHPDVARGFQNLGSDLYLQDDVDGALALLDSARVALVIPGQDFRLVANPELHFAIESARTEAFLKAFFSTNDTTHLRQAINITLALDQFTDDIRPNFTGRHARVYLQKLAKFHYERGLYACHLLWQPSRDKEVLDMAFYFMEKSKSLALYGAMQAARALRISGLPDSLIRQEEKLRADLANVEKRYWVAYSAKADLTALDAEAATLRRSYDNLVSRIVRDYPRYNSLCFNLPVRRMHDIRQKYVPKGTTMLQYFAGDTALYILALRSDTVIFREIPKTFPLNAHIKWLLDGITGYPDGPAEKNLMQYTRSARLLYDSLVAPVATWLDSQVIIIPDGRLALIPFEALLTGATPKTGRLNEYPYLLRRCRIRYVYSATLLDEMSSGQMPERSEQVSGDRREFSGFAPWHRPAPGHNKRDDTNWLEFSGEELRLIAARFSNPVTLYGEQASLQSFYDKALTSSVLHISSHAWADDRGGEHAYITFAPQKSVEQSNLFLGEIYNLSFAAKMVVLSACQTNTGKFSRGEGILSLTRAFAYARAKSIVSSFWKVNDPATKELMVAFYRNLIPDTAQQAKGRPVIPMTKDEALHRAKIQLADSNNDWAHPYYWAGFVLIGDNAPLR